MGGEHISTAPSMLPNALYNTVHGNDTHTKSAHCRSSLRPWWHILLSYFKTLTVGLVWESNLGPTAAKSSTQPSELNSWR